MQIRDTAVATPDKPAVIMYPSGTVVTFGELEARANRLAHLFRKAGLVEGDADHRDYVLSQAQRETTLITCQSRAAAAGGHLVLDL